MHAPVRPPFACDERKQVVGLARTHRGDVETHRLGVRCGIFNLVKVEQPIEIVWRTSDLAVANRGTDITQRFDTVLRSAWASRELGQP